MRSLRSRAGKDGKNRNGTNADSGKARQRKNRDRRNALLYNESRAQQRENALLQEESPAGRPFLPVVKGLPKPAKGAKRPARSPASAHSRQRQ